MKAQEPNIPGSEAYPIYASGNREHQLRHDNSFPCKATGKIRSNNNKQPQKKKLYKINQGSNFLVGSFSKRDNVRASLQFRRERQPHNFVVLCFSSRTHPSKKQVEFFQH